MGRDVVLEAGGGGGLSSAFEFVLEHALTEPEFADTGYPVVVRVVP